MIHNRVNDLPPGWELAKDMKTNRYFYVDHNSKTTTWLNPMDQLTKPMSVSECSGDQLPYGWERINDPNIGVYYTDHIGRRNQWTNPVSDWHQREMSVFNQHHYTNSDRMLKLEQSGNSLDSNNRTISPVTTSKPDNSLHQSDIERSATSSNTSPSFEMERNSSAQRSNSSTRNSKYDAGLLDIMDNRFGRQSSKSVEV